MFDFTNEQKEAIESTQQPMVLVAAAGSGKTSVLVNRYLQYLKEGLTPDRILSVTFTNEAARQMKERILYSLRDSPLEPLLPAVERTNQIGTLHSFCHKWINQFGQNENMPPIQTVLSPFEIARAFDLAYQYWLTRLAPEDLTALLEYYSPAELRDVVRTLYEKRHLAGKTGSANPSKELDPPLLPLLMKMAEPFLTYLNDNLEKKGKYSFDALEAGTDTLLSKSAFIRSQLQTRYRAVLVDEFQDTSPIQWNILKHIIADSPKKLFVVGDPRQSVYRFRNADVRVFHQVANAMEDMGGKVHYLNTNFRSSPLIVDSINKISQALFEDEQLTYPDMVSGRPPNSPAEFRWLPFDASQNKEETKQSERQAVIREIKQWIEKGTAPESIAVLFRASEPIDSYFRDLQAEGIPVQCTRNVDFFALYDVLDLLNYLRVLQDPLDDFALAAFLLSPYASYQYADLWALKDKAGDNLFENLCLQKDSNFSWLMDWVEQGHTTWESALEILFKNCRYFPRESESFLTLLENLTPGSSVFEAVEQIESWQNESIQYPSKSSSNSGNCVRLLTVHAAKGLEFSKVILADTARKPPHPTDLLFYEGDQSAIAYRNVGETVGIGDYSLLREKKIAEDRQESKRILYVALTRAKDSLVITRPQNEKRTSQSSWASLFDRVDF